MSVSAPAGTTTGDLVVVVVHANGTVTIVDNNGSTPFTEDLDDLQEAGAGQTVSVFTRRIVGGDPSTYSFTIGSSGRWTCTAVTFQNPHASVIYDVAPAVGNSGTTTTAGTLDSPSITTTNANAIHVVSGNSDGDTNTITGTPAGYTVQQNGGNQTTAIATKVITSPGSTGAQTWTDQTPDGWITLSFAIRDEGGGGPTFVPYQPQYQMAPVMAQ